MLTEERGIDRTREARPTATRVKLICRDEERFPCSDVDIDSLTLLIPVFVVERWFCIGLLRDCILHR